MKLVRLTQNILETIEIIRHKTFWAQMKLIRHKTFWTQMKIIRPTKNIQDTDGNHQTDTKHL